MHGEASRGEAMQTDMGVGFVFLERAGGERDVSQATLELFCYRCWGVEVDVVDFSRQRRSTR